MLTTNEAAEILGVKPVSIRVWLNEEGHPRFPNAQKFGRDWQIPESDLADLPRGRKRGRPSKGGDASESKEEVLVVDQGEAEPSRKAGKKKSQK